MSSKLHEIEQLYERVSKDLTSGEELCPYLLKIYNDLIITLSEASSLQFNTLFARVSFITSRYNLDGGWSYALQIPRREIHRRELSDIQLLPILHACIQYLLTLCHAEFNGNDSLPIPPKPELPRLPYHRRPGRFKKKFARVIAIEWKREEQKLTILDEEEPDTPFTLEYNVAGVNDIFSETLELALEELGTPLVLGLTDVDCTESNHYIPAYIVILPDLLMDVTSITQVVTEGPDPLAINAMDMFLPSSSTEAILAGQVANYLLDELIRDTSKSFQELFVSSFKIYPIEFVRLSDEQLKNLQNRMKSHYDNILKVIVERFPVLGIDHRQCVIEPSYFSPQYGIKGRLDLYYEQENGAFSSIIELKSNRPFKPNSYGLSSSNYHQTLLYDLLIKSSHDPKHKRANYILYSGESQDTLRYAASVSSIQKETIHNRNQLVLLQCRLMRLDQNHAKELLGEIDPARYASIKGYQKKNIENWWKVYSSLSPGEKNYFKCFTSFITREHMVARLGSERGDGTGGLAGLWLDNIKAKEEQYQILQRLELVSIEKGNQQTTLRFVKTALTNPLANFRSGDIAIMYPYEEGQTLDPTHYQLHRASVLETDSRSVVIRFRNMQIHTAKIEKIKWWNLEHDLLDSSFRSLYQSLWTLMSGDTLTRQFILGLIPPPRIATGENRPIPPGLTQDQERIYHQAIDSSFLYLLWGPPGTGKTSMMLKSWVWYYFNQTSSRIALLAYTNRAVDEICEVLHHSGPEIKDHYIRIGSRAATGEPYRHRLLDHVIEPMTKRAEIKKMLDQTRIFVATVASLQGKNEIFNLIHFDIAIMDEASQLLEPTIVGLLSRFKKSILIGDHMQLPAVSVQPEAMSKLPHDQPWCARIGLMSMNMSYFERLYRLYQAKGWEHLIGTLHEQGRMHKDIMEFSNQHVYKGLLKPVDEVKQSIPMHELFPGEDSMLFRSRLIYVPVVSALRETYLKTSMLEAHITVDLLLMWQKKIQELNLNWSIGVITPFRAQIATIVHVAHQLGVDLNKITVDTVERYQGGARDIILMSCAVNSQNALSRITSVNEDGVDRKLNVAVTRARQQFILIGAENVLRTQTAYQSLIDMSTTMIMDSLPADMVNTELPA